MTRADAWLLRDLAARLNPWLADRPTDRPVFDIVRLREKTARMIHHDMAKAEIEVELDGTTLDFHALRHTYVSRVLQSGATVKVAQELARHSDPKLTIGRYSHVRLHDLSKALDGIQPTKIEGDSPIAAKATGTVDENYRK